MIKKVFLLATFVVALLTPLVADVVTQKILFAADRNRTEVINQLLKIERLFQENSDAKILQQKYKLKYKEVAMGNYYALILYPIKDLEAKESLMLLLKPHFSDILIINSDSIEDEKRDDKIDTASSLTKSVSDDEIENSYSYLTLFYYWLEQWHAIIVLLLLGGFFYYRRHHQLSNIDTKYLELAQHQDMIEKKLKKR